MKKKVPSITFCHRCPKSRKVQMAPWHSLTRACPHTKIGTQEETPQGKHWHHLHPVCQRRHNEYANQQRKEAGHSTASKRLDTSSRPGQKAAISRHRPDVSQTRHCHPVNCYKATCHCGTDSTWKERYQSAYELKKVKYTDLQTLCKERGWQTVSSRSGLSRLSSTIGVDNIELPRHCRKTM